MVDSCKRPFHVLSKTIFPFSLDDNSVCNIKAFECTLNVLKDNNTIYIYGINNPLKCPSVRLLKYDDVTMSTCGKENPQGFYCVVEIFFFFLYFLKKI